MTRAMKPIEFNSAYILNMNLDAFVAVSIKHKNFVAYYEV